MPSSNQLRLSFILNDSTDFENAKTPFTFEPYPFGSDPTIKNELELYSTSYETQNAISNENYNSHSSSDKSECGSHSTRRKKANPEQVKRLTDIFNRTRYPSTGLRNALSKELSMTPRSIQIWFQNKRRTSTKIE